MIIHMNADGFSAKIPLIFGAAGHRDISPEGRAEIEACVKQELASYQRKFPHTPLILLSQLVPGADRLIAAWASQADETCQLCIVEVEGRGVAMDEPDSLVAELRQRAQAEIVLRSSDGATLRHGGASSPTTKRKTRTSSSSAPVSSANQQSEPPEGA
jgi:hypothetical protein